MSADICSVMPPSPAKQTDHSIDAASPIEKKVTIVEPTITEANTSMDSQAGLSKQTRRMISLANEIRKAEYDKGADAKKVNEEAA